MPLYDEEVIKLKEELYSEISNSTQTVYVRDTSIDIQLSNGKVILPLSNSLFDKFHQFLSNITVRHTMSDLVENIETALKNTTLKVDKVIPKVKFSNSYKNGKCEKIVPTILINNSTAVTFGDYDSINYIVTDLVTKNLLARKLTYEEKKQMVYYLSTFTEEENMCHINFANIEAELRMNMLTGKIGVEFSHNYTYYVIEDILAVKEIELTMLNNLYKIMQLKKYETVGDRRISVTEKDKVAKNVEYDKITVEIIFENNDIYANEYTQIAYLPQYHVYLNFIYMKHKNQLTAQLLRENSVYPKSDMKKKIYEEEKNALLSISYNDSTLTNQKAVDTVYTLTTEYCKEYLTQK